jgi:cbb3-type cytochrome oxidase maturation protein
MIVIFLLLPLSIVVAAGFLTAFIWAVRSGQYEDTCTPSLRLLLEEQVRKSEKHGPNDANQVGIPGKAKDD